MPEKLKDNLNKGYKAFLLLEENYDEEADKILKDLDVTKLKFVNLNIQSVAEFKSVPCIILSSLMVDGCEYKDIPCGVTDKSFNDLQKEVFLVCFYVHRNLFVNH